MSQQVNTTYGRALNLPTLAPIYLLTFEGVTTRYSTGPVTAPTAAYKPLLYTPQGAGAQITISEGRASLSHVSFGLLDKDGQITRLAAFTQLAGRQVTIEAGFLGMAEADYVAVFTGRVLDYTLANDNVTWQFQTTSLLVDQRKNIFRAATFLTAATTAVAAAINVKGTTDFPAATGGVLYLRIDDEVVSYTGKTATTFTGLLRGQLGTVAAAHAINAAVVNLAVLQGNPITLALQILTSTGLGTNGPYDVLPACVGLSIDQTLVDIARFEQERNRWVNSLTFKFEESETTSGKAFLEEQIYTFTNAYPIEDNKGRISMKVYAPPLPTGILESLDDTNMTGPPTFKGNVLANNFFNEVDLQYDFDFLSGGFLSRTLFEDANSQVTFGTPGNPNVRTASYSSRGMRTAITLQNRIDRFGSRFLKRFAIPSPVLNVRTLFKKTLVEVGDIVAVTSAFIPNLATGKMGLANQLMEVVERAPSFETATFTFTVLNTGYTYGRKYAAISPSSKPPTSFPNYLPATPVQRRYAFISKKVNNTRGIMSNGDDAYYITP